MSLLENGGVEQHAAKAVPQKSTLIRAERLAVLVLAGVFLLRYARDFFIPIALSILIAYALDPIVASLHRLRIPQALATAVVLLSALSTIGLGAYQLRHQAISAVQKLPQAAQNLREQIRAARKPGATAIGDIQRAAKEIEKTAAEASNSDVTATSVTKVQVQEPFLLADYVWSGSLGLLGLLGQGFLVLFLVFFILASGDLFKRKLLKIIGSTLSEKRLTIETLNEIQSQVGRFLVIQCFTSALVGVCTGLALWKFGVDEPAIWGLVSGITNSIPYFGPIIVTSLVAGISFLQFHTIAAMVPIAATTFFITSLEGMLLTPALMGRAGRINGVAMFVSLLFWSWLWGVIGMLVAVPITMVLKTICDRIANLQPFGELLGERATVRQDGREGAG